MGGLIWRLSSEEEMEATIKKIADLIEKYSMESTAVLFFESVKPLSVMGGAMARVFVAPWLHLIGINTRHVINTLEEPKNIEKLLQLLEKSLEEKGEKKKQGIKKEKEPRKKKEATEPKKGWRRFLPL